MRKTTIALAILTVSFVFLTYWGIKKLELPTFSDQTIRLSLDEKIESTNENISTNP
jgi:hypothetical protein